MLELKSEVAKLSDPCQLCLTFVLQLFNSEYLNIQSAWASSPPVSCYHPHHPLLLTQPRSRTLLIRSKKKCRYKAVCTWLFCTVSQNVRLFEYKNFKFTARTHTRLPALLWLQQNLGPTCCNTRTEILRNETMCRLQHCLKLRLITKFIQRVDNRMICTTTMYSYDEIRTDRKESK